MSKTAKTGSKHGDWWNSYELANRYKVTQDVVSSRVRKYLKDHPKAITTVKRMFGKQMHFNIKATDKIFGYKGGAVQRSLFEERPEAAATLPDVEVALHQEAAFQEKANRSFEAFNKWTESKGYTSFRNLFNAYSSVIQTMRAMNALKGNVEYPQSILMTAKDEFIEEAYRLVLEFFEEEEGGAK